MDMVHMLHNRIYKKSNYKQSNYKMIAIKAGQGAARGILGVILHAEAPPGDMRHPEVNQNAYQFKTPSSPHSPARDDSQQTCLSDLKNHEDLCSLALAPFSN